MTYVIQVIIIGPDSVFVIFHFLNQRFVKSITEVIVFRYQRFQNKP